MLCSWCLYPCIGVACLLASVLILTINEHHKVPRYLALQEGRENVVSVSSEQVDPANDGRLVHLTGLATTPEKLGDEEFGVELNDALKLRRTVHVYEWEELETYEGNVKTSDGKIVPTFSYSYALDWHEELINSRDFHIHDGHVNPEFILYNSYVDTTWKAHVGAYKLPVSVVERIGPYQDLDVSTFPVLMNGTIPTPDGRCFFVGEHRASPQVGDLKVCFDMVDSKVISLAGCQTGSSILPYETDSGLPILLIQQGNLTAHEMFSTALWENIEHAWAWRFCGFLCMFVGVWLILSLLGSIGPYFGSLIGTNTTAISLQISTALSLMLVALVWLSYSALVGCLLFASGLGVAFNLRRNTLKGFAEAKKAMNTLKQTKIRGEKPLVDSLREADGHVQGRLTPLAVSLLALLLGWLTGSALVGIMIQGAYIAFVCYRKRKGANMKAAELWEDEADADEPLEMVEMVEASDSNDLEIEMAGLV